jgi:hypothetical protein
MGEGPGAQLDGKSTMKDDYEVGYGKPPKHSQFKPNNQAAKGRGRKKVPKPTFSIGEILRDVLSGKRKIKRGDKVVEMDVARILGERLIQMILNGSARDMALVLGLLERHAPELLATAAQELAITYHRAEGSTVPLPRAQPWKGTKS